MALEPQVIISGGTGSTTGSPSGGEPSTGNSIVTDGYIIYIQNVSQFPSDGNPRFAVLEGTPSRLFFWDGDSASYKEVFTKDEFNSWITNVYNTLVARVVLLEAATTYTVTEYLSTDFVTKQIVHANPSSKPIKVTAIRAVDGFEHQLSIKYNGTRDMVTVSWLSDDVLNIFVETPN